MLLAYFQRPDVAQWEKLAGTCALTWLSSVAQWLSPEAGATLETRLESEPHFELEPMAQVRDDAPVLTRHHWQDWFAALGRSSRQALQKGRVERFLLRLFDDKGAREDSSFEASWRGFFQAWNLLQFSDGVEAVSSELIAQTPQPEAAVDQGQIVVDKLRGELAEDRALAGLLEYATEASRRLILAVAEAGLPLPTEDFELPTEGSGCGPEAELAWPDQKVVMLAEQQAEDGSAFEAAGWSIMVRPVSQEWLLEALKARLVTDE